MRAQFRYTHGVRSQGSAHRVYRDENLKVQCEVVTPCVDGVWGVGVKTYYIDGDEREFQTEQEMMKALEPTDGKEKDPHDAR